VARCTEEIREQVRAITHVRREEPMERTWHSPVDESDQPRKPHRQRCRNEPEDDPDDVWECEYEPDQYEQTRSGQVAVTDDQPHRSLGAGQFHARILAGPQAVVTGTS
jgi:hypothetical protein